LYFYILPYWCVIIYYYYNVVDLTVNLTQNTQGVNLPTEQNSDIDINTNTSKKRRILFSEVDTIHSSNSNIAVSSNLVNATKPILKKQTKKKV